MRGTAQNTARGKVAQKPARPTALIYTIVRHRPTVEKNPKVREERPAQLAYRRSLQATVQHRLGPASIRVQCKSEDRSAAVTAIAGKIAAKQCRAVEIPRSVDDQSTGRVRSVGTGERMQPDSCGPLQFPQVRWQTRTAAIRLGNTNVLGLSLPGVRGERLLQRRARLRGREELRNLYVTSRSSRKTKIVATSTTLQNEPASRSSS
jgi:hypothetical protein